MARPMLRTVLWLCAAASAAALAYGVHRAGASPDPAAVLVPAILAQVAIAVVGFLAFSMRGTRAAAHTRARWGLLDAVRTLVAVLLFGFMLVAAGLILTGTALGDSILEALLLAPLAACALSLLGALLEIERVEAPRPGIRPQTQMRTARKLYETRGGAVLEVSTPQGKEIVLTGRGGVERVSAVERAIDERRWREAKTPAPNALRAALQRWGQLDGKE